MIKKTISNLILLVLTCCLLCACGKEVFLLTAADYELDTETASTARGVSIGDGAESFISAYGDYMILCDVQDTSMENTSDDVSNASTEDTSDDVSNASPEDTPETKYQLLSADEVPYDTVLITILPTFFIDDLPLDTDQFCEDNEIEKKDLLSYLTQESYLADHRVIYRYLVFTWEDGVITDIRSESMDYNQDASYYEAN